MNGCVFSIQPFCVDDGPGIRSCVYLKGCNMRCAWCHNPESLSPLPETSFIADKCTGCGRCAQVCAAHRLSNGRHSFDRAQCHCGGLDAQVCPSGALSRVGQYMAAGDVIAAVARDRRYFRRSGGGMTVTGGEPLMQFDFLRELLSLARREEIGTCIETNASMPWEAYRDILPDVGLFLLDYKLTDPEAHLALTGVSNARIRDNIERICAAGARAVLRCPIIPGINDQEDHFRAIAELTARLPLLGFELMPYHRFGVSKSERLGAPRQRAFEVPTPEAVASWYETIRAMGGRRWSR